MSELNQVTIRKAQNGWVMEWPTINYEPMSATSIYGGGSTIAQRGGLVIAPTLDALCEAVRGFYEPIKK